MPSKTPSAAADPWARLERVASRHEAGRRQLVLAIGSGVNREARTRGGAVTRADGDSWAALLAAVARAVGCRDRELSARIRDGRVEGLSTLVWEALLAERVRTTRGREGPAEAERFLQRAVAERLRAVYDPHGPTEAFVRRLLGERFADVLSFNFDSALSVDAPSGWAGAAGDADAARLCAQLLGGTRAWYPHGHESRPRSIKLGLRAYGVYLASLDRAFRAAKARERERIEQRRRDDPEPRTWVEAALVRPLCFVGLSLAPEEWTLWWFLNQRARNAARRGLPPDTFVFTSERSAAGLADRCKLLAIELVTFEKFDEGWDRLLALLESTRPTYRPRKAP